MKNMFISKCALAVCLFWGLAGQAVAQTGGTVTYDLAISDFVKGKQASLWMPYPMSDTDQNISDVVIKGNYTKYGIYRDAASGAVYLYADWAKAEAKPQLSLSFHVDSHYKKATPLKESTQDIPTEIKPYLAASASIPSDNAQIRQWGEEATAGKKTILSKARAVYEWTIKNTHRDADVKGCGLGRALETMTDAKGGGKCADISSVFVAVARAAGIPARDVFGLRSSGKSGEITGDFHCWAEFYLPGTGWVMADPADVRKAMLVEKLTLNDAATAKHTEFFWNGDDLFRIALSRADRSVTFTPKQKNAPLEYFMYPYAEVDGKELDYRSPKTFTYTVTFKAD